MTAKEMRQFMQIPDNPKEGVLMMSDKFFYEFCEQLCREYDEYLNEDGKLFLIEKRIELFLKEKL